jgi:hypothetical protein
MSCVVWVTSGFFPDLTGELLGYASVQVSMSYRSVLSASWG